MPITGIKSRPIYTTLEPDLGGQHHLLAGQGAGGDALTRLLARMPAGADVEVIRAEGQAEALAALDDALSRRVMGTRLYLAGPEGFLGLAWRLAMTHGLGGGEVQGELAGGAARRVYCIHCKATSEGVTTNVAGCVGCGRHLLVRDHYSRRLAAYMGVMADAEAPGELPTITEVFG